MRAPTPSSMWWASWRACRAQPPSRRRTARRRLHPMRLRPLDCILTSCLYAQFRKIEEVENESPNTIIDVVGVVESVQSAATIQKKDGTETQKRALLLRDQSGRSVELSMWGNHAENPGIALEEVIGPALA